jgi:hypothetical protein
MRISMKNLTIILLSYCLMFACVGKNPTKNQEVNNTIDTLNLEAKVIAENQPSETVDTPEPEYTIPVHIFARGETLWELSAKFYGSRHYSHILALYNGINDAGNISPGTEIKIPELSWLIKDPKTSLVQLIPTELDKILKARELFMSHGKKLFDLYIENRQTNIVGGRVQINLTENMKIDLESAARLMIEAANSLRTWQNDSITTPHRMIGQLVKASQYLEILSAGSVDTESYDIDMVHQSIVHAFKNGMIWAGNKR